ncbi:Hypothetical protein, putative [Bodo saltans]|uniref:Scd6-like Sm domain-containing protein n=1 Tax=Bodo saltans TaxID=75058 RepID=A0A0S4IPY4_BODSA|nr:Hypothetical protein, putative [Bodo saltans]|eukprot:CUF14688.1 Hypothetical protein, putative [Bodo saltans]
MADHAVGSKISLISKSDIRYEGFLHFINPDENTVGLKNVRMFGTEGRKGGGANEVAAGDQLYEFIIFRGGDIKDLTVYEDRPRDPAIVSATPAAPAARQEPRAQTYAERAGAKPRVEERKDDRFERRPDRYDRPTERREDNRFERRDDRFERRDDRQVERHNDNRFERREDNRFERRPDNRDHRDDRRRDDRRDGGYTASRGRDDGGYTASRGRGGYNDRRDNRDSRDHRDHRDNNQHNNHVNRDTRDNRDDRRRDAPQGSGRGGRGNFGGVARPRPTSFGGAPRPEAHTGRDFVVATGEAKEQFKEEFDFSKSKEAFETKKNEFEKAKEDARAAARAYDKSSSFFDNISCETKEPKGPRMDREETKKADTETFGSEMVGSIRGFRRGRGGRGRYGGRF